MGFFPVFRLFGASKRIASALLHIVLELKITLTYFCSGVLYRHLSS